MYGMKIDESPTSQVKYLHMILENRARGLITVAEMRRDQCLDAVACEGSAGRFARLGRGACTRALRFIRVATG